MSCNKVKGIDFGFNGRLKLHDKNGQLLCEPCIVEITKKEKPNPSDASNKFIFDRSKMMWVLDGVKQACLTCGKAHWVNECR